MGRGVVGASTAWTIAAVACRQIVGIEGDPPGTPGAAASPDASDDGKASCGLAFVGATCEACLTSQCCAQAQTCAVRRADLPRRRSGDRGARGVPRLPLRAALRPRLRGGPARGTPSRRRRGLPDVRRRPRCSAMTACATDPTCQAAYRCALSSVTLDALEACDPERGRSDCTPVSDAGVASGALYVYSGSCSSVCLWSTNWSCLGAVAWPTAKSPTITLTVNVTDLGETPLAGVLVKLCDTVDVQCSVRPTRPGRPRRTAASRWSRRPTTRWRATSISALPTSSLSSSSGRSH